MSTGVIEPPPSNELKHHVVRGGFLTLISQSTRFALQTATTMIMGRLLTPADFGVVAMVAVFTGLVALLRDCGLSMATIQKREISDTQVNALFWINMAVGVALASFTAVCAPLLVWFYGDPRLFWPTVCHGLVLIIGGSGAQHMALLRRTMRFRQLCIIDIASYAISAVIAVALAVCGAGYWALVGQILISTTVATAMAWSISNWRPSYPKKAEGIWRLVLFGGNLTAFNFVNYFSRNADNGLVGWWWGAEVLGLYARAYGLLLLPISQFTAPVGTVAIPLLSRLQSEPERMERAYVKIVAKIALVTMPMMAVFTVSYDTIIAIMLGKQWEAAGPIFAWLGVAAIVQPVMTTVGWLFIAKGKSAEMLKMGFVTSVGIVVTFLASVPFGVITLAAAYALVNVILKLPFMFWYAKRVRLIEVREVGKAVWPILVASYVYVGLTLALRTFTPALSEEMPGWGIGFSVAFWLAVVLLAPSVRATAQDCWRLRTSIFQKR